MNNYSRTNPGRISWTENITNYWTNTNDWKTTTPILHTFPSISLSVYSTWPTSQRKYNLTINCQSRV